MTLRTQESGEEMAGRGTRESGFSLVDHLLDAPGTPADHPINIQ